MPREIDLINLIALFLAIWHTVRRLDAAKQEPADFPHVEAGDFSRWRTAALRSHNVVAWVCFGYIAIDLAFKRLLLPTLIQTSTVATQVIGASLFGIWAVGIAVGIYLARDAERLREDLGIEPGRFRDS